MAYPGGSCFQSFWLSLTPLQSLASWTSLTSKVFNVWLISSEHWWQPILKPADWAALHIAQVQVKGCEVLRLLVELSPEVVPSDAVSFADSDSMAKTFRICREIWWNLLDFVYASLLTALGPNSLGRDRRVRLPFSGQVPLDEIAEAANIRIPCGVPVCIQMISN